MTFEKIYDLFIDYEIATPEELELITCINGYNEDTLNDVLYVRTGYRDIYQYLGIDEDDEDTNE